MLPLFLNHAKTLVRVNAPLKVGTTMKLQVVIFSSLMNMCRFSIALWLLLIPTLTLCAEQLWTVRPDGVGPAKVGMSLGAVSSVLNEHLISPADVGLMDCFFVEPKALSGIALMFEEGVLTRIDIMSQLRKTSSGVALQDAVAKVEAIYGSSLEREPDHYQPETESYLTNLFESSKLAMRFEISEGKVRAIYTGFVQQVQYYDGCS